MSPCLIVVLLSCAVAVSVGAVAYWAGRALGAIDLHEVVMPTRELWWRIVMLVLAGLSGAVTAWIVYAWMGPA